MRRLVDDRRGVIYVEFLIAFTPIFLFFLGLVQMAMMYAAHLVVQHAAVTAARAAIVVLDDDPKYYNGAKRNTLDDTASCDGGTDFLGTLATLLGGGSAGGGGGGTGADTCKGGPRMKAIRAAAQIPLLAFSPSFEQFTGSESVYKAIGGNPAMRAVAGAALYNRAAVAVTFPTAPGSQEFKTSFGKDENITVRVTYLFHCAVPLVSRFMCNSVLELYSGFPITAAADLARAQSPEDVISRLNEIQRQSEHLEGLQPALQELDSAESPGLALLTVLTGARFSVLRAEATLPNHGASYKYPGEP